MMENAAFDGTCCCCGRNWFRSSLDRLSLCRDFLNILFLICNECPTYNITVSIVSSKIIECIVNTSENGMSFFSSFSS